MRTMKVMLLVLVLVAAAGRCSCQADQAPAPAPAAAGAPAGPPMPSADQLNSQFAAAYNQDIIINSDLFADEPAILSGGLGFTNIIGVATALNSSSEGVVRAANGTWRSNVTCASGQPPPTRVLTSASPTNMGTGGFNCTSDHYDGLPICFSWPLLPSTISKEAFLIQLSNGTTVTPPCVGISPNLEFNERQCVVTFGEFGNRIPSAQEGSLYVTGVSIAQGSGLKLVGPDGPVSAEGLSFTNPTGKSPYDEGNGPVIMVAKLSVLSDVAFPNGGEAVYGKYNGSLGADGNRYRLRLFYSGGMTPDGVMALKPTTFANHFYLLANGSDGEQEDWDNYIDIIIDASSPKAAAALTTLQAYQVDEGYASVYNPGGPGNNPVPGVLYSSAAPPQARPAGSCRRHALPAWCRALWPMTIPITAALADPQTVTYCDLNGTIITNAQLCTQALNMALAASAPPSAAPAASPAAAPSGAAAPEAAPSPAAAEEAAPAPEAATTSGAAGLERPALLALSAAAAALLLL
ncbi:hypothetical protein CHLNCDRAFT_145015 [Chlorella variabilis]|uniref:Uncharacterized protein n=1 Tax=Chlorella variabilis TaxID=554065 RepID=E1ZDI0_CHLVA|nr:hypothetical protein CHLNCDRAFT_145015 [Chlorella variabilis]EFN56227.1 hypothetical protein CHLNCDRAFT_145015 [Chlorella variabilis]|eukprot:XP_005848329.1 hypothetical protein CHLNCDRAFT_145015 [Chlorella variabilis]